MSPKEIYRTQKAQGVADLVNGAYPKICLGTYSDSSGYGFVSPPSKFKVIQKRDDIPFVPNEYFPVFARPCPVTPRHGFVDSRIANTYNDLEAIFEETLAADSAGEVIAMQPCTGKYSAVVTNAGVTWGWGNDGVTNMSIGTVFIPAAAPEWMWRDIAKNSTYQWGDEVPYIELVEDKGLIRAVQCRAGPAQTTAKNFVPAEWKVEKIIILTHKYQNDLLKWEGHINSIYRDNGNTPKGLVFAFQGGNLSSHFAVHCIQKGIPVVCTYGVGEGQVLQPEGKVEALTDSQLEDLAVLLQLWRMKDFVDREDDDKPKLNSFYRPGSCLKAALAVLHGSSMWPGDYPLLVLRAAGAVIMERFMGAAALGEARHFWANGPGNGGAETCDDCNGDGYIYDDDADDSFSCDTCGGEGYTSSPTDEKPTVNWAKLCSASRGSWKYTDRNYIYSRMLVPMESADFVRFVDAARKDFERPGWRGASVDGDGAQYGGRSWAKVAKVTLELHWAINNFIDTPSAENWTLVMQLMNTSAYITHNGGRVGTKWITQAKMDAIASMPATGLCTTFVAETVLEAKRKELAFNGQA